MILVVSQNSDLSTDKVMEWFTYYGVKEIVRVNEDDYLNISKFTINNEQSIYELIVKNKCIDLRDVCFFWYRRGNIHKRVQLDKEVHENGIQLKQFLDSEWLICKDFIFNRLNEIKSLGNCDKLNVNKLENLLLARECGLKIPSTILSDYNSILNWFSRKKPSITKPISETFNIMDSNRYVDLSTKKIESNVNKQKEIFTSLLQAEIKKWIELRVFINYDEIYAAAIFSQRNQKTKLDYRNYDEANMNRRVPFSLPASIKKKVVKFMNKCDLNTGSIDFILTPEKEYVFLEVNPMGNIEMVSESCNFYCEKNIAESIIKQIYV